MKVKWTRLAIEDLNTAYEYIAAENPSAAREVIGQIESALRALRAYPNLGRPGRVEGTRELIVSGTPFILAYHLRKNRIEILALVRGARRWPEGF